MRNFRGKPRCQRTSDGSSDEGDEDDLDFIYINQHPLVFTDDSDVSDEFDDNDRFAFNLVFNPENLDSSDDEEEEEEEDNDVEFDGIVGIEHEGIAMDGPEEVVDSVTVGEADAENDNSRQDYLIALEIDSNEGSIGCSFVVPEHPRNLDREEHDTVILPGRGDESPSIQVVHVGSEAGRSSVSVSRPSDIDMDHDSTAQSHQPNSPAEPSLSTHTDEDGNSDDSFHHFPEKPDPDRSNSAATTDSDCVCEEQFCNPMASDSDDEEDQNGDVLRGDRIGSTTYSERHVLKILMNWVEKLPTFERNSSSETGTDYLDCPLEQDFEDVMSLLWDMSAETDVIHFIMSHSILSVIRDTVDTNNCPTRLKEISLGILANILSCPSILENFPEKDEEFRLVDRIVIETLTCTKIPLLIQVFAVLRRVVCYLRNAKPLDRWMNLLLHEDFISAANFLLASSTNVILLGDVIMTLFTLMEVLGPAHDTDELSAEEKAGVEAEMTEKFKPFCESQFVPSLCEGLNELLKDSRSLVKFRNNINPPTDPTKLPQCSTTGNGPDDFEDDVAPPGHTQGAILNGIGSLAYLQKFGAGKGVLKKHDKIISNVLLIILDKFKFCTERVDDPEMLDYFALAVDLLGFCHSHNTKEEKLQPDVVLVPAAASMWLMEEGMKQNETHVVNVGTESTSVEVELESSNMSPYAIVFFNYLVTLKEAYGDRAVEDIMTTGKERYKEFYHNILQMAHRFEPEAV